MPLCQTCQIPRLIVLSLLVTAAGCGTGPETTATQAPPPAAAAPPADTTSTRGESAQVAPPAAAAPKRLGGYTVRVFKWAYYLVPKDLSTEQLLAQAAAIRRLEPDTQLMLVDDESGVEDYIAYAKAVSEGRGDAVLPEAWADAHIVANLQKLVSGKWMLYKGYGYEEIGEVK